MHDVFDIVYHQPRLTWDIQPHTRMHPPECVQSSHTNNHSRLFRIRVLRLLLMQILKRTQETSQKRNPHHCNRNVKSRSSTGQVPIKHNRKLISSENLSELCCS